MVVNEKGKNNNKNNKNKTTKKSNKNNISINTDKKTNFDNINNKVFDKKEQNKEKEISNNESLNQKKNNFKKTNIKEQSKENDIVIPTNKEIKNETKKINEENNKTEMLDVFKEDKIENIEKELDKKDELQKISDNKEIEENIIIEKTKNIYKRILLTILILCMTFILTFLIFFFPRIELLGEENLTISYKDTYVEPGYNVRFLNNDLSKDISVDSNLNAGVVGNYQIKYYFNKFGVKFEKIRNIYIVDKDAPKIEVSSNIINICPHEEVPEIDYNATDEYDGDITSFIEKTILDDKVILKVSDTSNNKTELSIPIDRVDNDSPIINLKGHSTMFLNYGSKYIEPGYTVSDNCSNELNDKVIVSGSVGREIGSYTLTYEVTDESGNKSSVSRKVIVGTKINDNGTINKGSIYLTFDDGPSQGTTNKILDILKEEGVKATFFVTCNGPDSLIKRMYDEGHTVALHTATHNYSYIYSSTDNYFNDLNRVSDRVKRITGENSKIIRFPGGSSNTTSRSYKKGIMTELSYLVLNQGYRYFDWNVDAMDASTARNSSDVYYNVTANLSMNRANVVLMHDTKNITAGAIKNIIKFGKENNYQFRKIDMDTYMVRHAINN